MQSARTASPGYLEWAFWDQHNVILLGGAVVLSLAFASWIPLAIGAGGELVWLALAPRLPAFKRSVHRRASERRKARLAAALGTGVDALGTSLAQRARVLESTLDEIVDLAADANDSQEHLESVARGLERLCKTFLEFANVSQRVKRALAEIPGAELEQQLARLNQSFATEKDIETRMSLRQAINQAQRRLSQWQELGVTLRAVDLALETLEKSAQHLKFRTRALASAGQLDRELEALLVDVGAAARFEAALKDATSGSH